MLVVETVAGDAITMHILVIALATKVIATGSTKVFLSLSIVWDQDERNVVFILTSNLKELLLESSVMLGALKLTYNVGVILFSLFNSGNYGCTVPLQPFLGSSQYDITLLMISVC